MPFNAIIDFCNPNQYVTAIEVQGKSLALYFHPKTPRVVAQSVVDHLAAQLLKKGAALTFDHGGYYSHASSKHARSNSIKELNHYHLDFDQDITGDELKSIGQIIQSYQKSQDRLALQARGQGYISKVFAYFVKGDDVTDMRKLLNNESYKQIEAIAMNRKTLKYFSQKDIHHALVGCANDLRCVEASLMTSATSVQEICDSTMSLAMTSYIKRRGDMGFAMLPLLLMGMGFFAGRLNRHPRVPAPAAPVVDGVVHQRLD